MEDKLLNMVNDVQTLNLDTKEDCLKAKKYLEDIREYWENLESEDNVFGYFAKWIGSSIFEKELELAEDAIESRLAKFNDVVEEDECDEDDCKGCPFDCAGTYRADCEEYDDYDDDECCDEFAELDGEEVYDMLYDDIVDSKKSDDKTSKNLCDIVASFINDNYDYYEDYFNDPDICRDIANFLFDFADYTLNKR